MIKIGWKSECHGKAYPKIVIYKSPLFWINDLHDSQGSVKVDYLIFLKRGLFSSYKVGGGEKHFSGRQKKRAYKTLPW